jgi:hypothetical protein
VQSLLLRDRRHGDLGSGHTDPPCLSFLLGSDRAALSYSPSVTESEIPPCLDDWEEEAGS